MPRSLEELPVWWQVKPPIYDIHKTYRENLEDGPFFDGKIPERTLPPEGKWMDFLGHRVAVPLGVPAGPLLNARWTTLAARMGFDIVTYKTIRSRPHPAHHLPNMVYVDTQGMLTPDRYQQTIRQTDIVPGEIQSLAVTNSFGIPSLDSKFLVKDIATAKSSLSKGQVLIVSVVGTPRPNEDFSEDFALASRIAIEGGATVIEADFSCPNVSSCEGDIFTSPETVFHISKVIKKEIGEVPLIIKIGVIPDEALLRQVMVAAAKAGVRAVCGINTVSMKVVREDGSPALGKARPKGGVCGGPIHEAALTYVRQAHAINVEEKLDMTIMGTGGVTRPEDFDHFFQAGADVAMSAAGMMWDPYLAARYHRRK